MWRASLLLLTLLGTLAGREASAEEKIQVVTTLPHLAAHAREVGGDRVEVRALARGDQDPHFIQPTPSLMVAAREADAYVEVGLQLELWSERVLDGARNVDVRVGAPGHLYASAGAVVLEAPALVSRALGDVHPQGNPHVWLHPVNGVQEARNIAAHLERLDPKGGPGYRERFEAYRKRILEGYVGPDLVKILGLDSVEGLAREGKLFSFLESKSYKGKKLIDHAGGWLAKTAPVRGARFIDYHRIAPYMAAAFGVELVGDVEPFPGVPPSPAHLTALEQKVRELGVRAVTHTPYDRVDIARSLAEKTGIRAVEIPSEVGAVAEATDYLTLMDALATRLSEGLK